MTSNAPKGILRRLAKPLIAAAISMLVLIGFFAVAGAQEPTGQPSPVASIASGAQTPSGTGEPQATPDQNVRTVVKLVTDAAQPIKRGETFEVRAMVDQVEHMSAFSFTISYDSKKVQPVKAGEAESTPIDAGTPIAGLGEAIESRGLGEIFASSPRADVLTCLPVTSSNDAVEGRCVTRAGPVCLGGPPGASGSGLLGAVTFKSKGGGVTTLTLSEATLVLDDYPPPCDPATNPQGEVIPSRRENLTIELGKAASSSSALMIIIIAAVAVVVVGGAGVGGYLWYRSRPATPSV